MHLPATVRFAFLPCACARKMGVLAGACIWGTFIAVLVGQQSQPSPEQAKLGDQHQHQPAELSTPAKLNSQEEGEKAVVAKRCTYLTSGKFTVENYAEFVEKHAFDLRINLATFTGQQCNWPQEFFVRLNGASLDYFLRELEARDNFRLKVQPLAGDGNFAYAASPVRDWHPR